MRLLGFINVFNQNPTFLQPVYWDDEQKKAYFQHSDDKVTISSFQQADLQYYTKNAKFILYPEKDIYIQTGSTVIFAIYVDGHTFWGDYLSIQNTIRIFIDNRESLTKFPGFYNTCVQFIDEYENKSLPDIRITKSLENIIIRRLFEFCSYKESDHLDYMDFFFRSKSLVELQSFDWVDCKQLAPSPIEYEGTKHFVEAFSSQKANRPNFVDLYFQKKIVPKLWTVDVIKDLIFSLARIRKTENYIRTLLFERWGLDILESLTPFREDLLCFPDLAITDIDDFIETAISFNSIENLYIIDFLKIKAGHLLIAENYFTKEKSFIATRSCSERIIEHLYNELIGELANNNAKKLYIVLNDSRIEKIAKQNLFFSKHPSKIRIVEFPISNKIEIHI